ncbi:hypothetical protein DB356_20245 [Pseudomonas congelans]|nr:hypothetical protein DB356_20245 [Pseudomonas congelans]
MRRGLRIGRRASRTAFLRWSVRNDNLQGEHFRENTTVPMLRVGMPFVTLRVTNRRRAARSGSDAECPEQRSHAGACGTIIFRESTFARTLSCRCSALACRS